MRRTARPATTSTQFSLRPSRRRTSTPRHAPRSQIRTLRRAQHLRTAATRLVGSTRRTRSCGASPLSPACAVPCGSAMQSHCLTENSTSPATCSHAGQTRASSRRGTRTRRAAPMKPKACGATRHAATLSPRGSASVHPVQTAAPGMLRTFGRGHPSTSRRGTFRRRPSARLLGSSRHARARPSVQPWPETGAWPRT